MSEAGAKRPLRVLYVTHVGAPSGNASSLRLLIQNFPAGAVEAHLLTPSGAAVPGFERLGVRIWPISGIAMVLSTAGVALGGVRLLVLLRTLWYLGQGRRIRHVVEAVRPDLVHMNEIGMFQVARIANRMGVPALMHVRGVMDQDSRWVLRLLRGMAHRWVTRTVAIDESVRLALRPVTSAEVVYNPLPGELLRAAPRDVSRQGPVRVTFLNTLIAYKGIFDLMESARLLHARGDIVFQIGGTNSRSAEFHASPAGKMARMLRLTRDVEADLREFIVRHGLQDRVLLLGRVEAAEILRNTDILVFPSHLNGAGRSVFEAGVLGIPSILALHDRVEDIVEDGVTGLIVAEKDPRALADAIVRLADDVPLRTRLGAEARRRYSEQFDGARSARQMLALYRSILE